MFDVQEFWLYRFVFSFANVHSKFGGHFSPLIQGPSSL